MDFPSPLDDYRNDEEPLVFTSSKHQFELPPLEDGTDPTFTSRSKAALQTLPFDSYNATSLWTLVYLINALFFTWAFVYAFLLKLATKDRSCAKRLCICHGFGTNPALAITFLTTVIARYRVHGRSCADIMLPYDEAGHTFDMDALYLELLCLSTLVGWLWYQSSICKVFVYATDERKPKWVNAGRIKDKIYDNRSEESKESEEEEKKAPGEDENEDGSDDDGDDDDSNDEDEEKGGDKKGKDGDKEEKKEEAKDGDKGGTKKDKKDG